LDEPQLQHLLQTAEAIRKDYPNEDWLHLTALIHDLGKVLLLPKFGGLPQWAVVGDTHPLGCAFDDSIVHHKVFPLKYLVQSTYKCTISFSLKNIAEVSFSFSS
jgi:inositol oxygenase